MKWKRTCAAALAGAGLAALLMRSPERHDVSVDLPAPHAVQGAPLAIGYGESEYAELLAALGASRVDYGACIVLRRGDWLPVHGEERLFPYVRSCVFKTPRGAVKVTAAEDTTLDERYKGSGSWYHHIDFRYASLSKEGTTSIFAESRTDEFFLDGSFDAGMKKCERERSTGEYTKTDDSVLLFAHVAGAGRRTMTLFPDGHVELAREGGKTSYEATGPWRDLHKQIGTRQVQLLRAVQHFYDKAEEYACCGTPAMAPILDAERQERRRTEEERKRKDDLHWRKMLQESVEDAEIARKALSRR